MSTEKLERLQKVVDGIGLEGLYHTAEVVGNRIFLGSKNHRQVVEIGFNEETKEVYILHSKQTIKLSQLQEIQDCL